MFLIIKDGLGRVAELDYLDQVSAVIAAVCHDFDHDGFTNTFHVNTHSQRAVRFEDESV